MGTEQRVAVITGASQRIGAGLVKAYRDLNYRVVATARTVKPSSDDDVLVVPGDIADRKTAEPAFQLQGAGYTPTELDTEVAVTLEPEGQGFRISRSALTQRAQVPNLEQAAFARIASDAEKNCPASKVLNAAITLDAKLV
jgi:NAD(P)-dependent dehydrogenase (short-subunit alcohol dehydrogenase family)